MYHHVSPCTYVSTSISVSTCTFVSSDLSVSPWTSVPPGISVSPFILVPLCPSASQGIKVNPFASVSPGIPVSPCSPVYQGISRASKMHVRAKFSRICAKILLLNSKLAKTSPFFLCIFGIISQSFLILERKLLLLILFCFLAVSRADVASSSKSSFGFRTRTSIDKSSTAGFLKTVLS